MINVPDNWDGAPCIGNSRQYTVANLPESPLDRALAARRLCVSCPHPPKRCAANAVEHRITGMVIAGVAVPEGPPAMLGAARRAIARIAEGDDIERVIPLAAILQRQRDRQRMEERRAARQRGVEANKTGARIRAELRRKDTA